MSKRRIFKQDEFRETGFGNRVVEVDQRLMNKDGSSNVRRSGLPFYSASRIFHELIKMNWLKFTLIIVSGYFIVSFLFAITYFIVDSNNIIGMMYKSTFEKFMEIFFFSAQSLTTVGYGRLNPTGIFNSTVAAVESLVGLLSFALATGLLYGRFSRPVANILYSNNALIAPYQGFTALMMRLANKSKSELVDPEATIVMGYIDNSNGGNVRRFSNLKLELTKVTLLTMSWTLVHPIDEESPLYGWSVEDYKNKQVEFLVLLRAYEETFAQTVHSRTSYRHSEIVFGAKFNPILKPADNGAVIVELDRINDHSMVSLSEEIVEA